MIYAIGAAGAAVRLYVECQHQADADNQRRDGEVCVEVADRLVPALIAADGRSVAAGSAE